MACGTPASVPGLALGLGREAEHVVLPRAVCVEFGLRLEAPLRALNGVTPVTVVRVAVDRIPITVVAVVVAGGRVPAQKAHAAEEINAAETDTMQKR